MVAHRHRHAGGGERDRGDRVGRPRAEARPTRPRAARGPGSSAAPTPPAGRGPPARCAASKPTSSSVVPTTTRPSARGTATPSAAFSISTTSRSPRSNTIICPRRGATRSAIPSSSRCGDAHAPVATTSRSHSRRSAASGGASRRLDRDAGQQRPRGPRGAAPPRTSGRRRPSSVRPVGRGDRRRVGQQAAGGAPRPPRLVHPDEQGPGAAQLHLRVLAGRSRARAPATRAASAWTGSGSSWGTDAERIPAAAHDAAARPAPGSMTRTSHPARASSRAHDAPTTPAPRTTARALTRRARRRPPRCRTARPARG